MADSILAPFDAEVTDSVILKIGGKPGSTQIRFQFPPKITSDAKTSNWKSVFQASWEPLKYYWGSEARKVTLEAEWIATGRGLFSGPVIAAQLQAVKRYFYAATVGKGPYPLVLLTAYEIVQGPAPFRLMDYSTSFGPELVKSGGDTGSAGFYPLYSKMTLSLELATTVSGTPGEGVVVKKPKIKVGDLKPLQPKWI